MLIDKRRIMTIKELYERLKIYAENPETANRRIEILLQSGMGYSDASDVANVLEGFDWNSNRIFLCPSKPLVALK